MENNQNIPNALGEPAGSAKELDKPKAGKSTCGCHGSFITVIVLIIVIIVAGYLVDRYTAVSLFGGKSSEIPVYGNGYQAVFLSNGQVYFGRVTKVDSEYTILEDIYYLQVSNALQQVTPPATSQQPQLSLVKLGNELHGPQDKMFIGNEHVLFVEDLKEEGRVVQAILKYKESGSAAPVQGQ